MIELAPNWKRSLTLTHPLILSSAFIADARVGAIITLPQAAALAVGAVKQQPVVKDGQLAVGTRMKITISADHRVTDGAETARFLQAVKAVPVPAPAGEAPTSRRTTRCCTCCGATVTLASSTAATTASAARAQSCWKVNRSHPA